jgi:diguanylate cyclase (GGDEF)-like protein
MLMTCWLPLALALVVCFRAFYWLPVLVQRRSIAIIQRDLNILPWSGGLVSLAFAGWSLALYHHGTEAQQSLVHYAVAITCFAGILSLAQSPATAMAMALAVMFPADVVFLLQHHPNRMPVVAVQIFVTALLLLITRGHHQDFVRMVHSRGELVRRREEMEEVAEDNRIKAISDPLTKAFNRRKILSLLEAELERKSQPWLALVDLDGFKLVNDTFGHAAGDAVLRAVCDRIEEIPEVTDYGRMGGDEFALILPGMLSFARVEAALEHLAASIACPIRINDLRLSVKGSIGVNKCSQSDVNDCLERADAALYAAKDKRDGEVACFNEQDERALHERREISRLFTSANLKEQMSLVYQPIVDSDTGRPVAFEALARWSPDGITWLPTLTFIELAETTGRISELTGLVLRRALAECPAWQWGCKLSINLSARDILRLDSAEWIAGMVAQAGAPPSGIVLEITESALVRDYRLAAENLVKLRQKGFSIALDDFGTGQSSLAHVHKLPFDHIKIDKSFAHDLVANEEARAIVGTIVTMARQLQVGCVLEGIETAAQQAVARSLGIRIMQGYHFGRPASAELMRLSMAA